MRKKYKKVCTTLSYIEHLLILTAAVTGCILISTFASLLGIAIGIKSSAVELGISAITASIKKYKSIIQKKKKNVIKLNGIEVLISKTLIDSNISDDEFILINNVLKE